jgi:heat shock transcription factor, other eukaryote
MTSQGFSRKRAAPGAEPTSYQQQMQNAQTYNNGNGMGGQQLSNDQFLQWGQAAQPTSAANASYNDNSYDMNAYNVSQNNSQTVSPSSNQLTRRPVAQIPVQADGAWADASNGGGQNESGWADDIADLEARAQVAKKEAQAKRKQIPPFVQKLNR